MTADGTIKIDTKLDSSAFKSGLEKMKDLASKANDGMKKLTNTVTAGMTAAAGAVSAAGTAVVKFGSEYESALAKTSTLFGDVAVNTDVLTQKTLALSNSTGIAASAISESLYSALSAGIPATEDMGDAMAYMESCAKIAKAGFTDVDTAVTATAKILNAYKMDVSKVDDVHKILMQTQNKGITTVGELGASLAQVTPTAAAMNVAFEQVGAGLATMTAAGTPTAQATTQLNALFAELGKSGTIGQKGLDAATKGTKYAGKGFQELMAAGVPLNEVLDLMSAYADKNDKSLLDMFSSIEAGKAALAMSGQNAETFTNNLAAMSTETDVVGIAYEKVSNTFEVNSQKIGNTLKNLGITMYQDVNTPLADITATAADMVQQLADAYSKDGLDGLLTSVGDVLSQAVTKVAEAAPKIVELGVGLITSLVDGLSKNSGSIIKAAQTAMSSFFKGIRSVMGQIGPLAGEIVSLILEGIIGYYELVWTAGVELVTQLVAGIAKKAPDLIKSAQNAIKNIATGLKKNLPQILKSGIEIAVQLIRGISEMLPDLLKLAVEMLVSLAEELIDNIDIIIDAAIECILALADAIFEAVPLLLAKLPSILEKLISSLVSGLLGNLDKILEAGIKILISLGEVLCNPVELAKIAESIISGLFTGLVSGIGSLVSNIFGIFNSEIEESANLKKADEIIDKENAVYEELVKQDEARKELHQRALDAEQDGLKEIEYYVRLADELDNLVDSNGKVKEGYEKRVDFILNELNTAFDTEYTRTGDLIENYGNLESGIYDLIEAKKAQILLDAHEEEYKNAVLAINDELYQQGEREIKMSELRSKVADSKKKADESEIALAEAKERLDKARLDMHEKSSQANRDAFNEAKKRYDEQKKSTEEAVELAKKEETALITVQEQYATAERTITGHLDVINKYQSAQAEMLAGNAEEAAKILQQTGQDYSGLADTVEQSSARNRENLRNEMENAEAQYNQMRERLKNGVKGITQDMVDERKRNYENAKKAYYALGEASIGEINASVKNKSPILYDHLKSLGLYAGSSITGGFNATSIGAKFIDGISAGIKDRQRYLFDTVGNTVNGMFAVSSKVQDSHSPSRRAKKEIGAMWGAGVEEGVEESTHGVTDAAENQIEAMFKVATIDADRYAARLRSSVAFDTAQTAAGVSNTVNYYNTSNISENGTQHTGALVNIEHVEINNDTDAEALGNELGFIISREDAFK